jgi:DNA-directed RNA polymerase specialized sigma24 family protein
MSCEHLRAFWAKNTPTQSQFETWIKKQTIIAAALRNRLRRYLSETSAELPEADAIVNETIVRILDNRDDYTWTEIGTFEGFFRSCMKTTMESLRSAERKHRVAASKFVPGSDLFTAAPIPTPYESELRRDHELAMTPTEFKRALATLIVKTMSSSTTRMGSTLKAYIERLPEYAGRKMVTKEIADDLGVKTGSVDAYRARARRRLVGNKHTEGRKKKVEH